MEAGSWKFDFDFQLVFFGRRLVFRLCAQLLHARPQFLAGFAGCDQRDQGVFALALLLFACQALLFGLLRFKLVILLGSTQLKHCICVIVQGVCALP